MLIILKLFQNAHFLAGGGENNHFENALNILYHKDLSRRKSIIPAVFLWDGSGGVIQVYPLQPMCLT